VGTRRIPVEAPPGSYLRIHALGAPVGS
jgi:hypothetical protein